ncbi:MAG: hypothetical protein WCS33_00410 [Candidatus Caldatribacteriota bacterium]
MGTYFETIKKPQVITEDMLEKHMDTLVEYLSFFRAYPDIFIDMISEEDCPFSLFFYQRLFLRIVFRYKYVYVTFTRAFSKSFLSILALYLKCMFYPGIKLFICAGGKEQAADIAKEKVDEIWEWWPCLENEIAKIHREKDYIKLLFKNGSRLDILPVKDSARGKRRHGGLIDEVILVDGEVLNKVIIPTMNVDRLAKCGGIDPEENHKSQIYVTTAGHKNSFAYDKMIQTIIWMIVKGNAFVFGGDWRVPVMHGLLSPDFIEELKEDGTYNDMSFSSEYESIWEGVVRDAFFNPEMFDRYRTLQLAETEAKLSEGTESFYIMGVDVARLKAQTAIQILKVTKRPGGYYKSLVNTFVHENRHFLPQAIDIKKKALDFNVKAIAIDISGLGAGLLDFLLIENQDDLMEIVYPPMSVVNYNDYDSYKRPHSLPLIYGIKPNDELNSQMYVNCLSQFNSGKIKLLIDEKTAKTKLLNTKAGRDMSGEQKARYLVPYTYTSILKQEMMNLKQKVEESRSSKLLKLEEVQKKGKDKFSAFIYALWYTKLMEDNMIRQRRKMKATDFVFFN